jgi:hypothetical protein
MGIQITAAQAPELLMDVIRAGLVPMIASSPGLGKSSIARQLAEEQNLKLIDVRLSQCDPVDLSGFPSINKETGKGYYVPMDMFPILGDTLPLKDDGTNYNGWLILLDEINSASTAVQAAAYKLLLDKEVGMHKLHPNVAMIAAGNLSTDKAIVNRLGTATQSRIIHFEMAANTEAWLAWANKNKIDFRITSFINFKPELLHKFDPSHNDKTFACPRTWEFLSKMIIGWNKIDRSKTALIAGTVSEGVGREFMGFCQIFQKLPTIQRILANPTGFTIDNEPSIRYAISGLLSNHLSDANGDVLMKAINRLPIEFQVICLQGAIVRDRSVGKSKAVRTWIKDNSQKLI